MGKTRTDLLVNNFVLKAIKDRVLVLYECEFMRNYVHIWDVCRVFEFVVDSGMHARMKPLMLGMIA